MIHILFLQGAGLLFRSSYETSHIRRTIHKDSVSQKTIDAFKDTRIWKAEMEFYEFARSHFDVIKNELTAAESGGANKRIYHYEKTRPWTVCKSMVFAQNKFEKLPKPKYYKK